MLTIFNLIYKFHCFYEVKTMKQRTLDYYFCGKKRERDFSIDDEDILECFEKAKEEAEIESMVSQMISEKEDEDEDGNRELDEDYMELMMWEEENKKRKPFEVCRELTSDERIERVWKTGQKIFFLPKEFTFSKWYWDASSDMRVDEKIKNELNKILK